MIKNLYSDFDRPQVAFTDTRLNIKEHLFRARVVQFTQLLYFQCRVSRDRLLESLVTSLSADRIVVREGYFWRDRHQWRAFAQSDSRDLLRNFLKRKPHSFQTQDLGFHPSCSEHRRGSDHRPARIAPGAVGLALHHWTSSGSSPRIEKRSRITAR